jgi:exo-beta-1,3-glucanase (GH17 family)
MSQQYSVEGDDSYRRSQPYTRPPSFSAQEQHAGAQNPSSPSARPNSQFDRLRAARRTSRGAEIARSQQGYEQVPNPVGPTPPLHRQAQGRNWGPHPAAYTDSSFSNVTPGVDNFGEQASGGIAGIAMGVADTHARESGLEAMRNTPGYASNEAHPDSYTDVPYPSQAPRQAAYGPSDMRGPSYPTGPPPERNPRQGGIPPNEMRGNVYADIPPQNQVPRQQGYNQNQMYSNTNNAYRDVPPGGQTPRQMAYDGHARGPPDVSHVPLQPLGPGAISPGMATPQSRSTGSRSLHSFNNDAYPDPSYNRYSRNFDPAMALDFDPNSIEDDGDDGLEYRNNHRVSMLSIGHSSRRSVPGSAGAAASGGLMGALGGLAGRNASGGVSYDAVHTAHGGGPSNLNLTSGAPQEKSEWLSEQSHGNKKMKWLIGAVVAFLIIGGIAGGVVGGILTHRKSSSPGGQNTQTASGDTTSNGDLNSKSPEIQALMNNKNLHKVFPGIDYTPINTQYPDCLTNPPSQNNVTRDLAVLSQLTNTIRLYGTDCNQTEMLLHSIDQLNLNGTIKVWLGVWQDNNATTNARQLQQMYDIFDKYGTASFIGVILGNEILFRQDMTSTQLGTLISDVRTNLTAKGISLPLATSDLGDDWTAELASEVDYLMANIHPFFAGVTAEQAASWTYTFWTGHDTILKTDISKNIISETGWPSTGGTDCGGAPSCTQGSVAGITEMNTFMDGWVCDALANGTNYFWFEAFDEPWKIIYDTPGADWEDKWGLMDVNRNLKPGVVIPDCGGKTV